MNELWAQTAIALSATDPTTVIELWFKKFGNNCDHKLGLTQAKTRCGHDLFYIHTTDDGDDETPICMMHDPNIELRASSLRALAMMCMMDFLCECTEASIEIRLGLIEAQARNAIIL